MNNLAAIKCLSINCVNVIAVNILMTTPRPKVMAKPRIGPVPKKNNTAAAIIVVKFESKL